MDYISTLHNKQYMIWPLWTGTNLVINRQLDLMQRPPVWSCTVYPKKYAHGFCLAVLCCGYTLTDFPISIRLTSLALWQSNDCPSASKATLMNMDKYFMWIHYERLHNINKAKHNKTVCIFLGIYCKVDLNHHKRSWLRHVTVILYAMPILTLRMPIRLIYIWRMQITAYWQLSIILHTLSITILCGLKLAVLVYE